MAARGALIPHLRNVKRWIYLAYATGFAAFFVAGGKGWLLLLPAALFGYGIYVSIRYWRCPQCGRSLPTKVPVPAACERCGAALRVTAGT